MKMQLGEIIRAIGAEEQSEQAAAVVVTSIAFDSRQIEPGALFVPLVGEQDGHQFIADAIEKGAVATFWQTEHAEEPTAIPVVKVPDPLKALQKLAAYYLAKVNPNVVAITGSNGKTTTKDMTIAVLATTYNVYGTHGNFNNEIGVPMTILGMSTNTEILVVEMGMDRPGQLSFLSTLVEPDVSVITMIGEAHIEFFGTRDKIADAKMEIVDGLKEDGLLIYNGDESLLQTRVDILNLDTQTFGEEKTNALYPTELSVDKEVTSFKVSEWPDTTFKIPLIGSYNVNNAMAAMLVGQKFHVNPDNLKKALQNFTLTKNRTEWLTGAAGEAILDDVYNANPSAMQEVLQAFSQVEATGKRIVVLGDMLELGTKSPQFHADLAKSLNPHEIAEVYLYGPEMAHLATALKETYASAQIHHYETNQQAELIHALQANITKDDLVMLKASNGMHLADVVKALI